MRSHSSMTRALALSLVMLVLLLSAFGCTTDPVDGVTGESATDAITTGDAIPDTEPDTDGSTAAEGGVTILYTNDVHSFIDNAWTDDNDQTVEGLSYAHLAQMKQDLIAAGEHVLVADAGDHIQGSVLGAMDQGETILNLMDGIYDVATIGNHEFDYGMDRCLSITADADYPYVSCNFVKLADGAPVLRPHVLLEVGGYKVGFVGVTTPETISSSAPAYFQDADGNFIYDILGGDELYTAVQDSIDALEVAGADYIIALGHMGVDRSSEITSRTVIEHVNGLDAFIDGHSHTEIIKEMVKDADGKEVLLTQTGYYLGAIGKLTISDDGSLDTEMITSYEGKDEDVSAIKDNWVDEVNGMLGQKIGVLDAPLCMVDSEGKRLVRTVECNLGNFVADSYYYYINEVEKLNCDIALINGGGLRADIPAGDATYKSFKAANPFGNILCLVDLTGQQILDALEWGSRYTTGVVGDAAESGAFLHAAGLIYTIDPSIANTVVEDDQGAFAGAPTGARRVSNVQVYDKATGTYLPLDPTKTYSVVGANYTLRNQGDGYTMLDGTLVKDYIVEDYMALSTYAKAFDDTTGDGISDITSATSPLSDYTGFMINYEHMYGAGRITFKVPDASGSSSN